LHCRTSAKRCSRFRPSPRLISPIIAKLTCRTTITRRA
jgi:hypothetical protein